MTDESTGRELGWEDEIENESGGGDFITLPAGTEAAFEVVGFTRERHTPSAGGKLPACNKAVVELHFEGFADDQTIKENLFLHSRCEGILCAFFTSIGQRQHGEKTKMDWSKVIGAKGRAKLAVREYEKKLENGTVEKRTINQVKQYLDPQSQGFTPGKF
jgi:hypothetical protein